MYINRMRAMGNTKWRMIYLPLNSQANSDKKHQIGCFPVNRIIFPLTYVLSHNITTWTYSICRTEASCGIQNRVAEQ